MVDDKLIPIFIISRDRMGCLKKLISALEVRGYTNIHIVDNASSYPPLLEYYKTLPYTIHYNTENLGHLVMCTSNIADPYMHDYYAYTDCDVIPAPECPDNFLTRFREIMERHPELNKVGFGLKTYDLPSHYIHKNSVIDWESQYWINEVEPGAFSAPIDTTFALIRPGMKVGWSNALRTGAPYVAQHNTWYLNLAKLPEDEEYYVSHVKPGISTWTGGYTPTVKEIN